MASINLLPTQVAQNTKISKTVQLLTRIVIAAAAVVILEGILGGGVLFFYNSQLTRAQSEHDGVVAQISALQSSEQNLLLIKDRLQKIQTILANRGIYTILDKYTTVSDNLPANSSLHSMDLTESASKIVFGTGNSNDLVTLINLMSDKNKFSSVVLDNLAFTAGNGFEVTFRAN